MTIKKYKIVRFKSNQRRVYPSDIGGGALLVAILKLA